MDVLTSNFPVNLESTSMVDGNGGEPPAKKQRFGDEMNRVAEIVLVLSALGRIRGGKTPTELELELMMEARSKLVGMCQEFAPKDIIDRDDIKAVIEDLGLNVRQGLGFRAPKLTISEKLSLGKRKMVEEANKLSTAYTSHLSHHFTMERPLNGASQGPATSSANYYVASWSAQPQSTISFSNVPDNNVSIVRAVDPSFRPFMSPSTNQPMQGMHYGQTSSSGDNHTEISKIIHKVLQPQAKQYPLWNPPSRDYMTEAMKCQMCEVTITEVESVLVCDACEKGHHLKCLLANNLKVVPKSDWHCSRCVQGFKRKPFPPQYGRVISSTAKKVGYMEKVNQQKPIITRSPGVQNISGFVSGATITSHSETASVNRNTTTSTTKATNIGLQGFKETFIRSPASVSLTKTPDPKAISSLSAVMNNGLLSKPLTTVGTMSSISPSPVGNQVPESATSNAIPSTPISDSLVARDSRSTAPRTADHSVLNTDLTTVVQALNFTSSSNSQLEMSHSENAKAIEGAAIGEALNVNDGPQASMENVARCENPSDSLNAITTPESGQAASKDGKERSFSETCQNHRTETPAATVILDKDSKIIAESSMPQENSADQTEKTASQPPSVPFNYHSQAEEETPNIQDSVQNAPGDSQEGKGIISSDDRYQEEPSEPEFDNSDSIKEVNS